MATNDVVPRADGEGSVGDADKQWGSVGAKQVVIKDVTITSIRVSTDTATDSDDLLVTEKAMNIAIAAGGIKIDSTNAVVADYTILDDDGYSDIDFTAAAVDRVCTLPTLSANIGRIIWISKVDVGIGTVTVTCEAGEFYLDGSTASRVLPNQGDTIALKGSVNGWKIF